MPATPAEILAEARLNIHAAVAECGDRRRMFAHHAATLSADAALQPRIRAVAARDGAVLPRRDGGAAGAGPRGDMRAMT